MNQKTTYELTIAEKLQQLPLPAMEDAIWARIKSQLDLDLPEGDGGGGNTPQAPSGGMWSAGLLAFVAAFLSIYFLTQKQDTATAPETINPATKTTPAPLPEQKPPPGQLPLNNPNLPVSTPPSPTISTLPLTPGIDSIKVAPLALQPPIDSGAASTALVPLPPLQKRDSLPPKPKTRGVKDITDADYRIVPTKRDST
jgi:hypothetical protein